MTRLTNFGRILVGSVPTFSASFTVDDVATDPDTVTFTYGVGIEPAIVLTYGVDDEITKDSVGNYSVALSVTERGRYYGRWEGTGTAAGVSELTFEAWSNFEEGYLWNE